MATKKEKELLATTLAAIVTLLGPAPVWTPVKVGNVTQAKAEAKRTRRNKRKQSGDASTSAGDVERRASDAGESN